MRDSYIIKVAVVEDDKKYSEIIKGYISKFSGETDVQFEVTCFFNGLDFIEKTDLNFDIVFFDIEMPLMNGLEAARRLRERDENVCLIFVTNMAQYALKGYEVNALDFLVKPVGYFNFSLKMKKALNVINSRQNDKSSVLIKVKNGTVRVYTDSIYYVEVSGHYLNYHTRSGDYVERSAMKVCESMLSPYHFSRCSNYCLVNLQYVHTVEADQVLLRDGDKQFSIAITRSRKKDFLDDLASFVRGD